MHDCINLEARGVFMRATVTIDDDVMDRARAVAAPGIAVPELVRLALETFTRVEAGKRLAALGGTVPDMCDIPRRGSAELGSR
jgi:hypothetical protein